MSREHLFWEAMTSDEKEVIGEIMHMAGVDEQTATIAARITSLFCEQQMHNTLDACVEYDSPRT